MPRYLQDCVQARPSWMPRSGLGESYAIVLPVVGQQTVQLPTQQLARDFTGYAIADLKARAKQNLPILLGIGLAAAALVILLKKV